MANEKSGNEPLSVTFVSGRLTCRSVTRQTLGLARTLIHRGHTVKTISPGGAMEEAFRDGGVDVELRKTMVLPVLNLFALRAAAKSVRAAGSKIIHVQSPEAAVFGSGLAALCGLPCVVTAHRFDSPKRIAALRNVHIVAVSDALREFLVNETKVPKDRIDVIPNGIDPEDYCSDGVLNRSDQVPVIGSVGRLEPIRGFEFFIKAARTVMNAGHAAEFVIVGSGRDEKRLREFVSAMGIGERFTFAVESADYRDRIRSMDVVVICPLKEGFGMTTLEAMACGKPVIASAVGGIYSMIKDGETGLLVPPKDPDDIAEKIMSLLLDPDRARQLGDNARASAKEHFTMEVVAEKMEEVYRRTMAE